MNGTARQTLTGIIRSRVASYQARQLAGVSQKTFAEELTQEGHRISYADFRTLYSRARKQLAVAASAAHPPASLKKEEINQVPETKTESIESNFGATHRPSDLDDIQKQEVNLRSLAKLAKRNSK